MIRTLEAQLETFFDQEQARLPYRDFARQLAEEGHARIAHLLRAVARSEEVRIQLMRRNFINCSEESDQIQVCPHCGLIINGEDLPETCPVDGTPTSRFERIE
jgi:rubrerythrin